MRNTAPLPGQALLQSPIHELTFMDLLLPPVEQQEPVSDLLDWLISDPGDTTVSIASQSKFVFAERGKPFSDANHG